MLRKQEIRMKEQEKKKKGNVCEQEEEGKRERGESGGKGEVYKRKSV